ncbi:hypothetical protein JKP88DRAFT_350092 [Tribonema minus]|uniref:SET domain-containing protein n=1 Tax=Tribonema minus TaxID=303371 RepID=A0A835YYW2_9STRA|nr:hypothetical protein JKP88DRAFT_350092 [Tribonema minus]
MAAKKPAKKQAATKISLRGFGGTAAKPSKEAAAAGSAGDGTLIRDASTLALYQWLDSAGVDMRKIAIADFGGLRGVMALEDIKKGQCIIEVPAKSAIDLGDEGTPGSPDLTTTDFFTEAELAMLQWPPVVDETRRRIALCEKLYEDVIKMQVQMGSAFNGKQVTVEDLKWAVFIVVSRVLTVVRGDDVRFAKLLIPGIDMFNHDASSPHVLTGRMAAGASLKVLAGADVKAGTQVNIAYSGGVPRSDRFIQDYGFLDAAGCSEADAILLAGSLGKRYEAQLRETTAAEDQALLEGGTLSPKEALAVQFRLALKTGTIRK